MCGAISRASSQSRVVDICHLRGARVAKRLAVGDLGSCVLRVKEVLTRSVPGLREGISEYRDLVTGREVLDIR